MKSIEGKTGFMRFLAVPLCLAVIQAQLFGQTAQTAGDSGDARLTITVVKGQGAIHNIRKRTTEEVAVQVKDAAGKPMSGAPVSFILPTHSASGEFSLASFAQLFVAMSKLICEVGEPTWSKDETMRALEDTLKRTEPEKH